MSSSWSFSVLSHVVELLRQPRSARRVLQRLFAGRFGDDTRPCAVEPLEARVLMSATPVGASDTAALAQGRSSLHRPVVATLQRGVNTMHGTLEGSVRHQTFALNLDGTQRIRLNAPGGGTTLTVKLIDDRNGNGRADPGEVIARSQRRFNNQAIAGRTPDAGRLFVRVIRKDLGRDAMDYRVRVVESEAKFVSQPAVAPQRSRSSQPAHASEPAPRLSDGKPTPVISGDRGRIIGRVIIGGSEHDTRTHNVRRSNFDGGWDGYIRKFVVPQLDWGVRRLEVHNPFGTRGGPMELDQYLEAKQHGLDWLTTGFVEAWQKVVEGHYTGGQRVEVIGYMGSPVRDPSMHGLYLAGDRQGYRDRAMRSLQPAIEAGMSIAFDAITDAPREHYAYDLAVDLENAGTRVYIETWPGADTPHWWRFNVIAAERFVQQAVSLGRSATRAQIDGEITRIFAHEPQGSNWDRDWVFTRDLVSALDDGDSVIVNTRRLTEAGLTLSKLLDKID